MLQQDTCRGQILDANSVCLCLGSPTGPTPNYTTEYVEVVCGSRSLYIESKCKLHLSHSVQCVYWSHIPSAVQCSWSHIPRWCLTRWVLDLCSYVPDKSTWIRALSILNRNFKQIWPHILALLKYVYVVTILRTLNDKKPR